MCIFCNMNWGIDRTICTSCIKDDDKLNAFHLLNNIEAIYNTKIGEELAKRIIDEYYGLRRKKKTQQEIYKIIISKYDWLN